MKKNKYEAAISCYNTAYAVFEFEADNAKLAADHVNHILNSEDPIGFDWDKHPGQMHYIRYRRTGTTQWKYIYSPHNYRLDQPKEKKVGDYIKENHQLRSIITQFLNSPIDDLWKVKENAIKLLTD